MELSKHHGVNPAHGLAWMGPELRAHLTLPTKIPDSSSLPSRTSCWSSLERIHTLSSSLFPPLLCLMSSPLALEHFHTSWPPFTLSFPTKQHTPIGQCLCQHTPSHPVPTMPAGFSSAPGLVYLTCWGMPTSCTLCWPLPFREWSTHFEELFWGVPPESWRSFKV